MGGREIAPDAVQEKQAIRRDEGSGLLEIGPVVLVSDMLEHADRDHPVERAFKVHIVHEPGLDRQTVCTVIGKGRLLLADGDAQAGNAVAFRGKLQKPAPARADIEHAHARLKADLAADEVELGLLRRVQRRRLGPIAAGIDHAPVQHGGVEIIAEIVVPFADLAYAQALQVQEPRLGDADQERQVAGEGVMHLRLC